LIRKIIFRILKTLRKIIFTLDKKVFSLPTQNKKDYDFLIDKIINQGIPSSVNFDFETIKKETISFVKNMRVNKTFFKYKFSSSQQKENIYSSIYACLIYDMYGELKKLTDAEKKEWLDYFDSFQSPNDGLWYDTNLKNKYYNDNDWWGARHLAVHMIAGYTALFSKPKYKISYVEKYYDKSYLHSWLDSFNWNGFFDHSNDVDNKIMNIAVIMQYNRDFFEDVDASKAINNLFDYLDSKINTKTGMWGECDTQNPYELSRSVQFAYHILLPYFYDKRPVLFKEKILNLTLKTQNKIGGYGEKLNSSACEDIDSIDLLIHLSENLNLEVKKSLTKALAWVLSNQNTDGGFVFRQNEPMWFGHEILTAQINESHLLSSWFRTLSLIKLTKKLSINNGYNYTKITGY
jgi:hypothetical protein